MVKATWKAAMEPFAEALYDFEAGIKKQLQGMSDDDLATLARHASKPTRTNCWWAVYRAARTLLVEIRDEQHMRAQRAEIAAEEQS